MGLDMYLTKETYIGAQHHNNVTASIDISVNGKSVPIQPKRVETIVECVGYWRKANSIHQWFVKNVQDGNDDCGHYYVSEQQLSALLETVIEVLDSVSLIPGTITNGQRLVNGEWVPIPEDGLLIEDATKAIELLPTSSGFFFGQTEYDQYYHRDLVYTKELLENVLKESGDFYYQASW